MKKARPDGTAHPQRLLDLWMGQGSGGSPSQDAAERAPDKAGRWRLVLALAVGLAGVVPLLFKFAIDVLLILLVIAACGLLLKVLGIHVVRSGVLSPGLAMTALVAGALILYAVRVPTDALEQFAPSWLLAALEWSEDHGFGGRLLFPKSEGTAGTNVEKKGEAPPSASPGGPRPAAGVVVTAAATTIGQGETLSLMGRLTGPPAAAGSRVRFYDGESAFGVAEVKADGPVEIAYLTTRRLAVGAHDIRAELIGPLGGTVATSDKLRVYVLRR